MLRRGVMPGGTHLLPPGEISNVFSECPTSVHLNIYALGFAKEWPVDVFWSHPLLHYPASVQIMMELGHEWQNDFWRHAKPFEPGQKIGPITLENRSSVPIKVQFVIIYLAEFRALGKAFDGTEQP